MPEIEGRPVISRADMIARGIGRSTVDAKYADRANSRHPEKAGRIEGTDYWFEDEWSTWFERYRQAKRAMHTEIDRRGEPDDLVTASEAAKIMGYTNSKVIFSNLGHGQFAAPDVVEQLPNGKSSPRWKRSTVWAFADSRPGKGAPREGTRQSRPAVAKSAPYAADERVNALRQRLRSGLPVRAEQVAGEYGVSTRTAERLIRAAREDSADQ